MDEDSRFCERCKRTLKDNNFYTSNNREKYPDGKLNICKACITAHVDNFDPDTYLWILQECDVPYIPDKWNETIAKSKKKKTELTGISIIGKYLSAIKLKPYKDYRWCDNEYLQELANSKTEQAMKRQGYSASEIAKTIATQTREIPQAIYEEPVYAEEPAVPAQPAVEEDYFADQAGGADIDIDLTEEDRTYLRLKWGKAYRPEEWVALEQLYTDMINSYDIQAAGDINTLKLACKTSLKSNQLLDMGDKI